MEYPRALFWGLIYSLYTSTNYPICWSISGPFSTLTTQTDFSILKLFSQHTIDALNKDLQAFYDWVIANKVTINLSKTCAMLIETQQIQTVLQYNVIADKLMINGTQLEFIEYTKLLGITIDTNLN